MTKCQGAMRFLQLSKGNFKITFFAVLLFGFGVNTYANEDWLAGVNNYINLEFKEAEPMTISAQWFIENSPETTVRVGQFIDLVWSAENAESCVLKKHATNSQITLVETVGYPNLSGSYSDAFFEVNNAENDTTKMTLICYNDGWASEPKSIDLSVHGLSSTVLREVVEN